LTGVKELEHNLTAWNAWHTSCRLYSNGTNRNKHVY